MTLYCILGDFYNVVHDSTTMVKIIGSRLKISNYGISFFALPTGLNLQTTAAILQTNQLLQNWMRLQYPNLGTDFALAGQQLSRNPALCQQYLARLQQLQQQSQNILLQGHTLLPGVAVLPSTTGQPFLGQQTLGLLGQGFYPGSSPATVGVTQPTAVQRTNSGAMNHSVHSAAQN